VTGGYPDVKRALRNRGWLENPDPYSPCFNLKYSLQSKELGDFTALKDF
jgi:tubulin monoglycylase TTLL3/8